MLSASLRFSCFLLLTCCPGFSAVAREPWTASRVVGSPEPPPPLKAVVRYSRLKFDQPLYVETDPARDRVWVIDREAKFFSFDDRRDVTEPDLFVDLRATFEELVPHESAKRVNNGYGLAFHPHYPKVPVCWIAYTLVGGEATREDGTRLSRFNVTFDADGIPRCDVASERVVLTWREGGHNGACLTFGPDGCLYISTGDSEVPNPPDPLRAGQDVTNLLSAILRIDVNATDDGPLYQIPSDNPFVGDQTSVPLSVTRVLPDALRSPLALPEGTTPPADVRPEILAYGFRNPWKMNFGPDGQLWVGDVGWEMYEMVYNVKAGGNYGWSIMEGPQSVLPNQPQGPTPILPAAVAYSHSEGASVTGGFVYRGSKFPELRGKYIFGDYETRRIWAADITPQPDGQSDALTHLVDLMDPHIRIVAFGEDASGELLLSHFDEGTLYEFERNADAGEPSDFPRTLSATGLFTDTARQLPAPGVHSFDVNVPMWQDGAIAERWVGVPSADPIEVLKNVARRKDSILREKMNFPTDSVLVRTVTLPDDDGRSVNLETQVLHFDGTSWNGYSYVWNAEQTDAALAPASGTELRLSDYGRFSQRSTWPVHSRSECLRCHNSWVGGPLAFTEPQLALSEGTENSGYRTQNSQLEHFRDIGLLSGALPKDGELNAMVNPYDNAADLAARARSYLAVNCSHCHQNGAGGTATIDLRYEASIDEMQTVAAKPAQGLFQIEDAAIVVPGQPSKSVLLYRTACSGRGRMPHIGSSEVDAAGVNLLREWIASLEKSSTPGAESPEPSLATTEAALQIVELLDEGRIDAPKRDELLTAAREAPPEIRNLFVRFQPPEYRRQLNRSLDPATLLDTPGDATRGAALFADKRLQCITCHRVGTDGGQIGPALDDVGTRLKPEEILESLLEPSKKIDPKFASWTAVTVEGKVHSGLLIDRSESEIVLRTTKNEDIHIPRGDIEELIQQAVSLMPDRQLNDLSDQQIADLLTFLGDQTGKQ